MSYPDEAYAAACKSSRDQAAKLRAARELIADARRRLGPCSNKKCTLFSVHPGPCDEEAT